MDGQWDSPQMLNLVHDKRIRRNVSHDTRPWEERLEKLRLRPTYQGRSNLHISMISILYILCCLSMYLCE